MKKSRIEELVKKANDKNKGLILEAYALGKVDGLEIARGIHQKVYGKVKNDSQN